MLPGYLEPSNFLVWPDYHNVWPALEGIYLRVTWICNFEAKHTWHYIHFIFLTYWLTFTFYFIQIWGFLGLSLKFKRRFEPLPCVNCGKQFNMWKKYLSMFGCWIYISQSLFRIKWWLWLKVKENKIPRICWFSSIQSEFE